MYTKDNGEEDEPGENLSSDGSIDTKAHQPANLLQVNGLISSQANTDAVSGCPGDDLSSSMINVSSHQRNNSDDFNQVQNFTA